MTALFWVSGSALALLAATVACQALYDLASRWSFEDTRDQHTTAGRAPVWMRPATAAEAWSQDCLCDHRRAGDRVSVLAAIDASLRADLSRHGGSFRAALVRPSPVP